jgi:hypothetical protein
MLSSSAVVEIEAMNKPRPRFGLHVPSASEVVGVLRERSTGSGSSAAVDPSIAALKSRIVD